MEWNLNCLRAIAELRTPLLDTLMQGVTELGGETLFMLFMLVVFWCVDKNKGYFLMLLCFTGTAVNQMLKITFCIPRPWVLDPSFEIVESARAGATGFSFPSGHTQNAVAAYGGMFCHHEKALGARGVHGGWRCSFPFSRLYLGVHTPLDVGVSFLIGWLLVLALYPLLEEIGHRGEVLEHIWLILLVPAALFLLYALRVRAARAATRSILTTRSKPAWSMLGLVLGAIVSVFADRHYTRFETQAVWWAQILKVVLGLALTLAVRVALKAPLTAAFGANSVGDGIRYFAVVLMAGTLWPMTFGWFSLMGPKKVIYSRSKTCYTLPCKKEERRLFS